MEKNIFNKKINELVFLLQNNQILKAEKIVDKDAVIINMSNVPYIDASGIYVLEEIITNFKAKSIDVIIVGINDHIFKQFQELELIPTILPEENAYNSVRAGVKYLKYKFEKKNN